jgi:hypothetical protein
LVGALLFNLQGDCPLADDLKKKFIAGRARQTPYSFFMAKKSKQKKAPNALPFGFPQSNRGKPAGRELASLKHSSC